MEIEKISIEPIEENKKISLWHSLLFDSYLNTKNEHENIINSVNKDKLEGEVIERYEKNLQNYLKIIAIPVYDQELNVESTSKPFSLFDYMFKFLTFKLF